MPTEVWLLIGVVIVCGAVAFAINCIEAAAKERRERLLPPAGDAPRYPSPPPPPRARYGHEDNGRWNTHGYRPVNAAPRVANDGMSLTDMVTGAMLYDALTDSGEHPCHDAGHHHSHGHESSHDHGSADHSSVDSSSDSGSSDSGGDSGGDAGDCGGGDCGGGCD